MAHEKMLNVISVLPRLRGVQERRRRASAQTAAEATVSMNRIVDNSVRRVGGQRRARVFRPRQ